MTRGARGGNGAEPAACSPTDPERGRELLLCAFAHTEGLAHSLARERPERGGVHEIVHWLPRPHMRNLRLHAHLPQQTECLLQPGCGLLIHPLELRHGREATERP